MSCDVPRWLTTNVPRVVSTPCNTSHTYCGNWMTRSSCGLSVVLYWRRRRDGHRDFTSRRRDVTDTVLTVKLSIVDGVDSHSTYDWSATDTRQIPMTQSATYSWRSSRQTTMSRGAFIPSTLMTTSSGLCVSALYRRIAEDQAQTTYMMLSSTVTPHTLSATYNICTPIYHMVTDKLCTL